MLYYYPSKAGKWSVADGNRVVTFDSEVQAHAYALTHTALTEQEATAIMAAIEASETPIAAELAQRITGVMLPNLRAYYGELANMQLAWNANGVSEQIKESQEKGVAIVGFDGATWALWGATFNALQTWLETPNEAIGGEKPLTVLMRRYVATTIG